METFPTNKIEPISVVQTRDVVERVKGEEVALRRSAIHTPEYFDLFNEVLDAAAADGVDHDAVQVRQGYIEACEVIDGVTPPLETAMKYAGIASGLTGDALDDRTSQAFRHAMLEQSAYIQQELWELLHNWNENERPKSGNAPAAPHDAN
jgi:hypothetical protein